MNTIFYRAGIELYWLAICLAAPFQTKARAFIRGRRSWQQRLKQQKEEGSYAWFHCASMGEFEQGRPVIEAFRHAYPEMKIALSFFSPSGYENAKHDGLAELVFYLPKDNPKNAEKLIEILKPKLAVFVKYEYWYYLLKQLKDHKTKTLLISAHFRKDQIFFKPWGRFFLNMLHFFEHIFIQNTESEKLLKQNGISHCTHSGDTRFDRVISIAEKENKLPVIEDFTTKSRLTLVAGSTWPADERLIANGMSVTESMDMKLILAPHEFDASRINKLLEQFPYSESYSTSSPEKLHAAKVLIIDKIGILSRIYAYADLAYIGGGFGKGIHNTLEAAVYGIPLIFGPKYHKFHEAKALIKEGAAISVSHTTGYQKAVIKLLSGSSDTKSGRKAVSYIKKNAGSTQNIIAFIKKMPF